MHGHGPAVNLAPMLATTGALPADDGSWAYEVKWDGIRALVTVEGDSLSVTSRAGNDVTASYPELRGLADQVGVRSVVLDGEVVAFGAGGVPDFGLLQSVHTARSEQESTALRSLLIDAGIRCTVTPRAQAWEVLVFSADADRARALVRS